MRRLFRLAVAVACGCAIAVAAGYIHDQNVVKSYMGGSEGASDVDIVKRRAKQTCFSRTARHNDVGDYRLRVNAVDQGKAIVATENGTNVVALDLAARGKISTFVSQDGWFGARASTVRTYGRLWDVADACGRRIDAASVVTTDSQEIRLEERNRQVLDYAESLLDAYLSRKNIKLFVPANEPAAVGVIYEGRYAGRIDFARGVADFYGTDVPLAEGQTAMGVAQAVAYAQAKVIMDKLGFGGKFNLDKSFADLQNKWDETVQFNIVRQTDPSAGALADCLRTTVENTGPHYQRIHWGTGLMNENLLRVTLVYKTPTALDRMFPKNKTEQASIWVGFDDKKSYRIELETIARGERGENWAFTNLRHDVVDMSQAKSNLDALERDDAASRQLLSRLDMCMNRYVNTPKPALGQ